MRPVDERGRDGVARALRDARLPADLVEGCVVGGCGGEGVMVVVDVGTGERVVEEGEGEAAEGGEEGGGGDGDECRWHGFRWLWLVLGGARYC